MVILATCCEKHCPSGSCGEAAESETSESGFCVYFYFYSGGPQGRAGGEPAAASFCRRRELEGEEHEEANKSYALAQDIPQRLNNARAQQQQQQSPHLQLHRYSRNNPDDTVNCSPPTYEAKINRARKPHAITFTHKLGILTNGDVGSIYGNSSALRCVTIELALTVCPTRVFIRLLSSLPLAIAISPHFLPSTALGEDGAPRPPASALYGGSKALVEAEELRIELESVLVRSKDTVEAVPKPKQRRQTPKVSPLRSVF